MSLLLVAPIAVTLLGAAACLALWGRVLLHQIVAVSCCALLLAVSIALLLLVSERGIQVTEVAGWPAPFGIVLVADLFSAIMVCLTGIIGLSVVLYSLASMDQERSRMGYYPLLLVLLAGVSGAFLTGDFFNLYVWFEVMLMASFVLLALGGGMFQLEGALKYVTLNILASSIFLGSLGLLYSNTGTLNFADLSLAVRESSNPGLITSLAVLFMVAFGIKAALFPLFFWLPSSYHTPPVEISAVFAGLLTKVGVYVLIRVYSLVFVGDVTFTHELILVLSGATMLSGVLGAVAQNEFRRILSFHIVSQIGYMTLGLGLFTTLGLSGAIFYIAHHIIVKTNLFLVSGAVHRLRGTYELKALGGLQQHALLSILFLIPAMSLAGIPPLSGFFAKLSLVQAGFESGDYSIIAIALLVGFFTLFSMTKIWTEVFAKPEPAPVSPEGRLPFLQILPIVSLAVLTVAIGIGAGPLFELTERAAEQLLDRSEYVSAVLQDGAQP